MTTTQTRTQTPEPRPVPTIEEFWEFFTKSQIEWEAYRKELAEENDARQKKWAEERDARQKEWEARQEKIDRQLDKLTKNVGGLNNSMGELIETLIAARLWEKFSDYPYDFKRAYRQVPVFNEDNRVLTEIDILLSNNEWVMAVEVKRELKRIDEVDHHVRRMERIRKYPPLETIGKKLVGAMAGGVVKPDVRDYIHEQGFFVLELTGENVGLVKPTTAFTPREW